MQDFQAMPDSMKQLHLQQSLLRVHQQRKKKLRSVSDFVANMEAWQCYMSIHSLLAFLPAFVST